MSEICRQISDMDPVSGVKQRYAASEPLPPKIRGLAQAQI